MTVEKLEVKDFNDLPNLPNSLSDGERFKAEQVPKLFLNPTPRAAWNHHLSEDRRQAASCEKIEGTVLKSAALDLFQHELQTLCKRVQQELLVSLKEFQSLSCSATSMKGTEDTCVVEFNDMELYTSSQSQDSADEMVGERGAGGPRPSAQVRQRRASFASAFSERSELSQESVASSASSQRGDQRGLPKGRKALYGTKRALRFCNTVSSIDGTPCSPPPTAPPPRAPSTINPAWHVDNPEEFTWHCRDAVMKPAGRARTQMLDLDAHRMGSMKALITVDKETGVIAKFVASDTFDQVMGVFLLLNAAILGIQVNWQAGNLGRNDPIIYKVLDLIFCVVFAGELLLRLYVHKVNFYFMAGWQWSYFDTFIVSVQILEEIADVAAGGTGMSLGFLKLLKIGRLLRMVRMVRLIPELKSMVYLILASMSSFFWTCVLLMLLIYMMAVYFTMMATDSMQGTGGDDGNRVDLEKYWGSIGDSVMTLFWAITGGADWADLILPLTSETNTQIHHLVMTCFIAFSTMVLMNLVTGVFVDGAGRLSRRDKEMELAKLAYKTFEYVDVDGSESISRSELEESFGLEHMQVFLKSMQLSESSALNLFDLLDEDGSDAITVDEFVRGCSRLKGPAKASDVCQLLLDMTATFTCFRKLRVYLVREFEQLNGKVNLAVRKQHELQAQFNKLYWPNFVTEDIV
eukprot:TRINITY_DN121233_c0_g1_i1.p1 TRINITY_DN121233_c0_g1~~TRINITY_DN121233_c0_g1_i1.p1  ORF type:complete len:722 (-),score=184.56 TRINITY_DN121233_c0_g1_i1:255-2324(-)